MKQEVSPTYIVQNLKKIYNEIHTILVLFKDIHIHIILFYLSYLLNTNNRRGRDCTFLNFKLISDYFNY